MNEDLYSEDVEDFLAHFGVKGMRWGVRKAITRNNQAKVDIYRRVASGHGDLLDKAAVGLNSSPLHLLANKGNLSKTAKGDLDHAKELQKRVNAGESKVHDLLLRSGGVNVRHLNYSLSNPGSYTRAKGGSGNLLEKQRKAANA